MRTNVYYQPRSGNSSTTNQGQEQKRLTWVTFSVTLCVRSMSLQGAMMSISPAGRAMRGSGLKSTKLSVICGILLMARYRMRSESEVEFRMLDLLFMAPAGRERFSFSLWKSSDYSQMLLTFTVLISKSYLHYCLGSVRYLKNIFAI